jgi:hypothetical protein
MKKRKKLSDFQVILDSERRARIGGKVSKQVTSEERRILEQNLAKNKAMFRMMFDKRSPEVHKKLVKYFRERPRGYKFGKSDVSELLEIIKASEKDIQSLEEDPRNLLHLRSLVISIEDIQNVLKKR